jgi:two-component system, chemotaxis family, chemotaxis protein CheY
MAPQARRSILVIDDDAAMREALEEVLRDMGIHVHAAADGQEGLERLRAGPRPCAVLLDMKMPRLDGEGFLRALRADPHLRDLPVVTMSGDDAEPALEVAAWLHKPFDLDELARILASLCE